MYILLILLRLIHVFAGVFWAGTAFAMSSQITPAVKASGEAGVKFMQQLGIKSNFSPVMGMAATLTFLSGLIMYIIFYNQRGEAWV